MKSRVRIQGHSYNECLLLLLPLLNGRSLPLFQFLSAISRLSWLLIRFPFVSRGHFASRRRVCFRIRGCIRYFRSSFRLVTRISIQRSGLIESVSYRDNNKQPCIHIRTYMYTHVHIYAHASVST